MQHEYEIRAIRAGQEVGQAWAWAEGPKAWVLHITKHGTSSSTPRCTSALVGSKAQAMHQLRRFFPGAALVESFNK